MILSASKNPSSRSKTLPFVAGPTTRRLPFRFLFALLGRFPSGLIESISFQLQLFQMCLSGMLFGQALVDGFPHHLYDRALLLLLVPRGSHFCFAIFGRTPLLAAFLVPSLLVCIGSWVPMIQIALLARLSMAPICAESTISGKIPDGVIASVLSSLPHPLPRQRRWIVGMMDSPLLQANFEESLAKRSMVLDWT